MNKKRSLLLVNNNLATGGVQKSLINLIQKINGQFDITLYLFSNSGDHVKDIPPQVRVIEAPPLIKILGISQAQSKKLGLLYYLVRALCVLYSKLINNHLPISLLLKAQRKLKGYDIAISFLHSGHDKSFYGGCNEFVLERVLAKQKVAFIHCDFLKSGGNTKRNRKNYQLFNKVALVSHACRNVFIEAVPAMSEKAFTVYNVHNYAMYKHLSHLNPIQYEPNYIHIVTVARLSPEKGILRFLHVMNRLREENERVRWHIIGEGALREKIEEEVEKNNLSNHIILHGNQQNPYRFLRNASLLLLPSFHEAAPMVFEEAKYLGVPVITTRTMSASEMIKDNVEGIICDNSEEGLYEAVKRVLDKPFFIEQSKEVLKSRKFSNHIAIEQFMRLIQEEGFQDVHVSEK